MRFFIQLLLIVSFSCTIAYGQQGNKMTRIKEEPDLQAENLYGPVASVITRGYKGFMINDKPINGMLLLATEKQYNKKGFLTSTASRIGFEKIAGQSARIKQARAVYKYDDNGHLIGSCSYNADGSIKDSSVQEVDKMGNRTQWSIYRGDGSRRWQYLSEYDNNGNLLETTEYNDGLLTQRHTFIYNDYNKCILESDYNADNRLQWKEVLTYDEKGNKVEAVDYKGSGGFDKRYTYKYNVGGKPIEERIYKSESDDKFEKIINSYDSSGNLKELWQYDENDVLTYHGRLDRYGNHLADITYNPNGTVRQKIAAEYKYDDHDNELEEISTYIDGSKMKTNSYYTYDKWGNWKRKVVVEDDSVGRIIEREIDYY
jgi:hypothetical protein